VKQIRLLAFAALGLALVILAGCGGSSDSTSSSSGESTAAETTSTSEEASGGGKDLTFVSYGEGAYQEGQESAWVEPWEEETGGKVTIDSPSENAKLSAQVDAGNVTWDVVDTDPSFAEKYCGKYTTPIELGSSLESQFPKGSVTECGVPDAFFGLLFMYNEKKYGDNPPTSLKDFFDPEKFPGQRIIMSSEVTTGLLEAALLAEGTPPDQLYPLDVDKALATYDKIKPDLTMAQTYGQQEQAMVGDQADMALVVSARAYSTLEAGGTFWKPVWDQVPVTWDVLVIPKGAPNEEAAQEFVKFASEPKQAAGFASAAALGPANEQAKEEMELSPLAEEVNVFTPEHEKQQVLVDVNWWAENFDQTVEEWTNWTTGG